MIRPVSSPSVSFAGIAKLIGVDFDQDIEVSGIAQSAVDVELGDIFLAIQGAKHHGIEFLDQAITNGAVAVITDEKGKNSKLPTLIEKNPKDIAGVIFMTNRHQICSQSELLVQMARPRSPLCCIRFGVPPIGIAD